MSEPTRFPTSIIGKNNTIEIHPTVTSRKPFPINVHGNNNTIIVGAHTVLGGGVIEIRGHDSTIRIDAHCSINGELRCRARKTHIRFGSRTTIGWAQVSLHEAGTISLGEDCMLSGGIVMDVSDMHSIIDIESGKRINPPGDITIGDHVWIAQGVSLMKGVSIGRHSIIGARSVVAGDIPENALAAGIPARVIRTGVTWDRHRLSYDD